MAEASAAGEGLEDGAMDITLTEMLSLPASETAHTYLSHLTTLELATLVSEPSVLQTQSHHLTSSLTSLTHTSYPTFLSLHRTTTSLSKSLASLESSLDSLLNASLPALEEGASRWTDRTERILRERKRARVVLEQHDKIRDLLDIPLLIDTCVRNGYFAEALSLASHANSLSKSFAPPLILTSILSEVQSSITQMHLSLLATLHEPNRKLPALWKAVNFLRKMDVFGSAPEHGVDSEEQIALIFLGGREGCLKAALEGCRRDIERLTGAAELKERDKEDLARFLKKYIDVWREGVYDIVTQYSTIFLERPPSAATTPKSPQVFVPNIALYSLLTTYTTHALTVHLLPVLSKTLPFISTTSLPSLLTQLTYCATAFARVGMDFRGVLDNLFCAAVSSSVGSEIKAAGKHWVGRVKGATGAAASPTSPTLASHRKTKIIPPSQWIVSSSALASPPVATTISKDGPAHVPPQILASYPPLAEYINSLLGTLNGLRLLAPIGVLGELVAILDGVLYEGGEALLGYVRRVYDDGGDGIEREERVARAVGDVYFGVFAPFIRRALVEGVYGVKIETWSDGGTKLGAVVREWEGWLEMRNGAISNGT